METDVRFQIFRAIFKDIVSLVTMNFFTFDLRKVFLIIALVVAPLIADPTVDIVNLLSPLESDSDYANPNIVKAACNLKGDVMFFWYNFYSICQIQDCIFEVLI